MGWGRGEKDQYLPVTRCQRQVHTCGWKGGGGREDQSLPVTKRPKTSSCLWLGGGGGGDRGQRPNFTWD